MKHVSHTFQEYLLYLLEECGLNNAEVYKRAIITKQLFSKIKLNPYYHPDKGTALPDALGGAVHHSGNIHKYAREEDRPAKNMFIITTDGQENSSYLYTYDKVKKMVERQQKEYGWEFLFLGVNMDAVKEADRFGIRADRAVRYECDSRGTAVNYIALNRAVSSVRSCASADMVNEALEGWAAEVEEDYGSRKK